MPINYLAVLVSGIAAMAMGALWYGPLFGKVWMKLQGFTSENLEKAKEKGMTKSYIINFIGALVTALVLAIFLDFTSTTTLANGILTGSLLWLGFIATTTLSSVLWESKPWKLYFLNNLYSLINLIVMSIILTAWV